MKIRLSNWAPHARKIEVVLRGEVLFWCGFNWKTIYWFAGFPMGPCFYSWNLSAPIGRAILLGFAISLLAWLHRAGGLK